MGRAPSMSSTRMVARMVSGRGSSAMVAAALRVTLMLTKRSTAASCWRACAFGSRMKDMAAAGRTARGGAGV